MSLGSRKTEGLGRKEGPRRTSCRTRTALLGTNINSRLQRLGTAGPERSKQARLRRKRSPTPIILALRQNTEDDLPLFSRGATRFPRSITEIGSRGRELHSEMKPNVI